MPSNTKKILMVQHASGILDFKFIRKTIKSLGPNDKITVLAIIQKTSDNKGKQDVKEKLDEYSKCTDIAEIRILAQARQVEFNVAVEAGSPNEVAVEYAKKFEATRVHLPWSFSIMQEEEQNQEYSSHNSLVERLLLDKLAEFVSSGPQLSSTMADRGKGHPKIRPLAEDPPEKIRARRVSGASSSVLPPRKSHRFWRLKGVSPSVSSLPSKKQMVEDQPCNVKHPDFDDDLETSDTALGMLPYPISDVIGTVSKFWVQKHSENLQGFEDNQVKNGALSYMVKAMVYTIENNNRTSKLLSETEGLIDKNAKLQEKIGEMQDELKSLKSKMRTRLKRRDGIVRLKAKITAPEEKTEKAKKEATEAIENFKETKEYRALREELYHQGAAAVIESVTEARPDYDLSFLYSSCEDEDKISTDEDLEDWKSA
ncbi:unnamed protein product [Fraxinus pennsylvanica]|uniref:Uncharacterized protein n=1 Tax=Fraxinus pennsylvanica TaxID=56036 RepID=A0AAD2E9I7_9LAMI|nr:unnamed protein product [Fraxinus pennsylvanica]